MRKWTVIELNNDYRLETQSHRRLCLQESCEYDGFSVALGCTMYYDPATLSRVVLRDYLSRDRSLRECCHTVCFPLKTWCEAQCAHRDTAAERGCQMGTTRNGPGTPAITTSDYRHMHHHNSVHTLHFLRSLNQVIFLGWEGSRL